MIRIMLVFRQVPDLLEQRAVDRRRMYQVVAEHQELLAQLGFLEDPAERVDTGGQGLAHEVVRLLGFFIAFLLARVRAADDVLGQQRAVRHAQLPALLVVAHVVLGNLAVHHRVPVSVRVRQVRVVHVFHEVVVVPALVLAHLLDYALGRLAGIVVPELQAEGVRAGDHLDGLVAHAHVVQHRRAPGIAGVQVHVLVDGRHVVTENAVLVGHLGHDPVDVVERLPVHAVEEERVHVPVLGIAEQDVAALQVQDVQGAALVVFQEGLHAQVGHEGLFPRSGRVVQPRGDAVGHESLLAGVVHAGICLDAVRVDHPVVHQDREHLGIGLVQGSALQRVVDRRRVDLLEVGAGHRRGDIRDQLADAGFVQDDVLEGMGFECCRRGPRVVAYGHVRIVGRICHASYTSSVYLPCLRSMRQERRMHI